MKPRSPWGGKILYRVRLVAPCHEGGEVVHETGDANSNCGSSHNWFHKLTTLSVV